VSIVERVRSECRVFWALMDSGQKAAIRTAYQNLQAVAVVAFLAFVSSVVAWLSGADIDMLGAVATLRAAIGAALLASIASFRAYYMNRGGKGASYH